MKYGMRMGLALGFLGVIAMTAVAFGKDGPVPSGVATTPAKGAHALDHRANRHGDRKAFHGLGGFKHIVTGEFKVKTPTGFATARIDTGTVTSVAGRTLTFKRLDDQTVTVTATDQTRIGKDGHHPVALSDIKPGDRVRVLRVDDGSGFTVRAIRAHSPNGTHAADGAHAAGDAHGEGLEG